METMVNYIAVGIYGIAAVTVVGLLVKVIYDNLTGKI